MQALPTKEDPDEHDGEEELAEDPGAPPEEAAEGFENQEDYEQGEEEEPENDACVEEQNIEEKTMPESHEPQNEDKIENAGPTVVADPEPKQPHLAEPTGDRALTTKDLEDTTPKQVLPAQAAVEPTPAPGSESTPSEKKEDIPDGSLAQNYISQMHWKDQQQIIYYISRVAPSQFLTITL